MNKEKINETLIALNKEIDSIKSLEDLKQLKAKYLKIDLINDIKKNLKEATNSEVKKELGNEINIYLSNINNLFSKKQNELENSFFLIEKENPILKPNLAEIDFSSITSKNPKLHPLTKLSLKVKQFFDQINYQFLYGNEVEIEKYNFDLLNIPANHSARSMHDSFYFKNNKMLRTHSTNITARRLEESSTSENYFFSIGSVFRNDDNDATHSFQFNQIDFSATTSNGISIADLKKIVDEFLKFIFERDLETRYRISYFPFTEPSFEVDIKFYGLKNEKWVEVLGCGILNNKVISNTGFDPNVVKGFAAGIGLERIAMLKWNINDIRNFYLNDVEFLDSIGE